MIEYADRWALVTGASSGIGAEFANKLAARGMHLILAARREPEMKQLADDLHTRHGTKCEVIQVDLSEPESPQQLFDAVAAKGISVELLINNAGFGMVGTVDTLTADRVTQLVQVNVSALSALTYLFLPQMLERGHGGVCNVASIAGFQPVAYMAAYAASKAFVLHFSEALWAEVKDRGVTVMALCPGTTRTDFFDHAGVPNWLKKHSSQDAEQVVKAGLKGLDKNRQYYVSGWKNYILSTMVRLASRRMVVNESKKYFRPQKPSKDE